MPNFQEAIAVEAVDSCKYNIQLQDDWCIGSVPHGGYVTSCFLAVTQKHFSTTLVKRDQPHALALHLEFLRRTSKGPATLIVQEKKLGAQTSVVHVSLVQDGNREEVVGYVTHTNLHKLKGLTLNTNLDLGLPEILPVDLTLVSLKGEDANWVTWKHAHPQFRKALGKYHIVIPREGRKIKNVVDEWIKLKTGERITNITLGSISDTFPLLVEGYFDEIRQKMDMSPEDKDPAFWFPTLLLNLEIKKALPDDGVEWLFVRIKAKEIRNGRNDLDIVILDQHGDVVALSHHVAMILDATRNLAQRSNREQDPSSSSKI